MTFAVEAFLTAMMMKKKETHRRRRGCFQPNVSSAQSTTILQTDEMINAIICRPAFISRPISRREIFNQKKEKKKTLQREIRRQIENVWYNMKYRTTVPRRLERFERLNVRVRSVFAVFRAVVSFRSFRRGRLQLERSLRKIAKKNCTYVLHFVRSRYNLSPCGPRIIFFPSVFVTGCGFRLKTPSHA